MSAVSQIEFDSKNKFALSASPADHSSYKSCHVLSLRYLHRDRAITDIQTMHPSRENHGCRTTAVTVLGIYVADLVFFGQKIPQAGETVLGNNFVVGPGGKGSNQAVAASKAGVKTHFISKIGDDQFGRMAIEMYDEAKVDYSNVSISKDYSTGAAAIMVDEVTGANAINVYPGASGAMTKKDIDDAEQAIRNSKIFLTQLEARNGNVRAEKASDLGVTTMLNPAPAACIDKSVFPLIDYFTPNEIEAVFTSTIRLKRLMMRAKPQKLTGYGVKNVVITLGEVAFFASAHEAFFARCLKNPRR